MDTYLLLALFSLLVAVPGAILSSWLLAEKYKHKDNKNKPI